MASKEFNRKNCFVAAVLDKAPQRIGLRKLGWMQREQFAQS